MPLKAEIMRTHGHLSTHSLAFYFYNCTEKYFLELEIVTYNFMHGKQSAHHFSFTCNLKWMVQASQWLNAPVQT